MSDSPIEKLSDKVTTMMSKKSFRLTNNLKAIITAAVVQKVAGTESEVMRMALQEFGERHAIEIEECS